MNFFNRIDKFNHDIDMFSPHGLLYSYIDLFISALILGASFDDYIRYRFWEKSFYSRNQFITYTRSKRIIKRYNNSDSVSILNNKVEFNKRFEKYIGRDWVYIDGDIDGENYCLFCSFINKNPKFICKPVEGGQGKGIQLISLCDDKELFYKTHKGYIIEQVIQQNSKMKSLNPTSVNTIRVLTMTKNGFTRIVAASLRTGGAEGCTDNLHSGGVCASVDIETGIVYKKELTINISIIYFTLLRKQKSLASKFRTGK